MLIRPAGHPRRSFRASVPAVVAAAVGAAALVRLWGIGFGLPLVEARPDEPELVRIALAVLHGDLNPHFFNYPSAFIYALAACGGLLAAAGMATGVTPSLAAFDQAIAADPSALYLMARLLAAASGVATVYVAYRIGRETFGARAGIAAAVVLAFMFLHARDSHFGVTDVPLALLIAATVLFVVRADRRGRWQDYAAAGAYAGLAVSTKYNGLLLAVPLGILVLSAGMRRRETWGRVARLGAVAAACAVVAALAATPYAVLDYPAFVRDFTFEMRHLRSGHGTVDLGRGWLYHATFTLPLGSGLPVLASAALGLASAARQKPVTAALLFSYPLCYYLSAGTGRTVFVRYMVPLTPFIAVAAGVGVSMLLGAVSRAVGPSRRGWAAGPTAVVLVAVAIGTPSIWRLWQFDRLLSRTDSRLLAGAWLQEHAAEGARVYQSGSRYGHVVLGPGLTPMNFDERAARFGAPGERAGDELPDWLVIQTSPLVYYSQVPGSLVAIAERCFELERTVAGVGRSPDERFDQQDAFFVPLAGGGSAARPGPDIALYRRVSGTCTRPDDGGAP